MFLRRRMNRGKKCIVEIRVIKFLSVIHLGRAQQKMMSVELRWQLKQTYIYVLTIVAKNFFFEVFFLSHLII